MKLTEAKVGQRVSYETTSSGRIARGEIVEIVPAHKCVRVRLADGVYVQITPALLTLETNR